MSPTLSVVIPVRDDAVALARCLQALREQTRRPEEVVVVDNGSSDDSARVATQYGARVVCEPIAGIPAAASRGYDAARGDVLVRCDADTVAPPAWLQQIHQAFAADPGLVALTGPGHFYDLPAARARAARLFYMRGYYWGVHAALAGVPLWGSNMAIRRSCWQQIGSSVHRDDQRVHDDIDLSFQLAPGTRVRYDPALVVGVSGRTFATGSSLWRRFDLAFHTLAVNWGRVPPWRRWSRRLLAGRIATSTPATSRQPHPDQ